MARPLPTMDTRGQIRDPQMKLQWILSYFITTEQSQTNLFQHRVLSLPDINRKYNDNIIVFKQTIEEALKRLLDAYFDSSEVFVDDRPSDQVGKMTIIIKANAQQDGKWYGLSESLAVSNEEISKVTEFSNKYAI